MQKKIIGGVFHDQQDAIHAIQALKTEGYDVEDISVFSKNKNDLEALENKTGASAFNDSTEDGKTESIGKGAGIGAGSGGILGALVGLGLVAIPGLGPIAAAGPLAATLTGAGIGAGGGGIVGALVGAGIPEEHAKDYEDYLKNNHIVVLLEADVDQEASIYNTFTTHHTLNTHMYPNDYHRGARL